MATSFTILAVLDLATNVQFVKGIGPKFAQILLEKGITTVEDLLYYLPFRYEDRLNPRGIGELRAGEMASIIAEVRTFGLFRTRRMPIFEMTVGQGRDTLKCVWFNAAYLQDKFRAGMLVSLYGKVEAGNRGGHRFEIIQPQFEILHDPTATEAEAAVDEPKWQSLEVGRIVPIYETAGNGRLSARWFRRVLHTMLEGLDQDVPDAIPAAVRGHMGLIDRRRAFWQAHWPEVGESLANLQAARTPAHVRLIFEELFFLELGLELKRRKMRAQTGIAFEINDRIRVAVKKILPFHPTAAQKRVLKEIAADMAEPAPMRRLLQGDVGSGKTIVALEAAVIAMENGYQARTDGAHGDSGDAAFSLRAPHSRARRLPHCPAYRIAGSRPQEAGAPSHCAGQRATGDRHPRADPGDRGVRQAGAGHRGRAASLRRAAALPPDEEDQRSRARRAGDDGDAHPAHPRANAVWRSRHQCPR